MTEFLFKAVTQRQGCLTEGETIFQFLQRGGRNEVTAIRPWMEKWFWEFPVEHKAELKVRLQSKAFRDFMGAYFELQVFALLHRLGCAIEVHPPFSETGGTVDFHVMHGKESFFVEATVCGIGKGNLQSNANEKDAVRKIRTEMRCPHSDIWLHAEGELLSTLAKDRLVAPIGELLDTHSAEDVRARNETFPFQPWHWPQVLIEEGDWKLEVSLLPPIASNGKGDVYGPSRAGATDGSTPIAKALRKKVEDWTKKGSIRDPFLIAINVCHSEYLRDDERRAIFGSVDAEITRETFVEILSPVSGVIVFKGATLGCEKDASVQLYRNMGKRIPKCLEFLGQETRLGEVIGFD